MKTIIYVILSVVLFILFYLMILTAIVLVSAGLLAIPLSLIVMSGIFTQVASDLSPPVMLLAGVSCLSAGLAMTLAVFVMFEKQTELLRCLNK